MYETAATNAGLFTIDELEITRFLRDREARDALFQAAKEVAAYAANIAPKASGEGAASIHPEWVGDDLEVSWDRDHYYMWFQEHGTVHMPAHPFLEPTLDRYRFY
jgi:HK97 gp10 family phage protein